MIKGSDLIKKALDIAREAYEGEYDKGGTPLIFHAVYVALRMDDDIEKAAALLHDVLEVRGDSLREMLRDKVGEEVTDIVSVVTRRQEETYFKYINRVKTVQKARKIKLADLEHNCDTSRVEDSLDSLQKRYRKAIKILSE